MILCDPLRTCGGVTVTGQVETPVVELLSTQVPVMLSLLSEVTETVPVGYCLVPAGSVSVTVTVAVLTWPVTTPVGLSETAVVVERLATVKSALLLLVS